MNLALHTGNQALTHLRTQEFQSKWKSLYARCPWATACQHPDYVTPWYEIYHAAFQPVVIVAEAEDHSLAGILTLALYQNRKKLVGAGERQAEYQCWLEQKETDSLFIREALQVISTHFPGADLYLRYLPSDIPLNWIADNREYAKNIRLRSHPRPLMKIDETAMRLQSSKKKYRRNVSQLKKSGTVQFDRIAGHDQFIDVFDELCMQYDFRQGVLYRYMPFSSDPRKKLFYLELHKRGLLHTTILTVDGKIAASHSGLLSNDATLHMGISTHAPTFSGYSPGKILLSMLGMHLVKERMTVLDLTPGGDPYKENFASEHDVVFELSAYGDVKARLGKEAFLGARRFVKRRLQKAGMRTADVWAAIGKLTRFKELGLQGSLGYLQQVAVAPTRVYRLCADQPCTDEKLLPISKDCLTDMFRFKSRGSLITRWEFLSMAMERLEKSSHLYSFSRDEKLLMCCWIDIRSAEQDQQLPGPDAALSESAIVLSDLYVHRQLTEMDLVRRFIRQMLVEVKDCHDTRNIYFSGALNNQLQAVIKQCGFCDASEKREGLLSSTTRRRYSGLFSKGIK